MNPEYFGDITINDIVNNGAGRRASLSFLAIGPQDEDSYSRRGSFIFSQENRDLAPGSVYITNLSLEGKTSC